MRRTAYFQSTASDSESESDTDADNNIVQTISHTNQDNGCFNTRDNAPFDHYKFREPSTFDPPAENFPALDTFCKTTRLGIYKFETKPTKFDNLNRGEKQAIKDLTSNPHIIIKQADKGGCTVVMNTIDYITEAERQLSKTEFYTPQTTDLTPTHNLKVKTLLDQLSNTAISQEVANFLYIEKPKTPSIYFLPKIHKQTQPPPGRPIVSANNCPTERISGLTDFMLRPYVEKTTLICQRYD